LFPHDGVSWHDDKQFFEVMGGFPMDIARHVLPALFNGLNLGQEKSGFGGSVDEHARKSPLRNRLV
jgi:hypothetical protein